MFYRATDVEPEHLGVYYKGSCVMNSVNDGLGLTIKKK